MRKLTLVVLCFGLSGCGTPMESCTRNLGSMMFYPLCVASESSAQTKRAEREESNHYTNSTAISSARTSSVKKLEAPKKSFPNN